MIHILTLNLNLKQMIKQHEAAKAKQECHLIIVKIKSWCKSAIFKIYLNDKTDSNQLFKRCKYFFYKHTDQQPGLL